MRTPAGTSGKGTSGRPVLPTLFSDTICGAVAKPDEVANGVAQYPECGTAFEDDFNGGYQFVSVLTHARGRSAVRPPATSG